MASGVTDAMVASPRSVRGLRLVGSAAGTNARATGAIGVARGGAAWCASPLMRVACGSRPSVDRLVGCVVGDAESFVILGVVTRGADRAYQWIPIARTTVPVRTTGILRIRQALTRHVRC
jgi:hypothetical protein